MSVSKERLIVIITANFIKTIKSYYVYQSNANYGSGTGQSFTCLSQLKPYQNSAKKLGNFSAKITVDPAYNS